jgi:pSer/pThr/pTyr-binding forkhead associated (FHA) protein
MFSENPKFMAESVNMPRLVLKTPQGTEILELSRQETWTFGRSADNTVRLKDPFASRYHAKIEVNRLNHCYFVDLNSRNGTSYNGQSLITPVWLKPGDCLSIGETTLVFEYCQQIEDESPAKHSPVSVLMVQGSASQGQIWQEVFKGSNISVLWQEDSATLRQIFEERAAANALPKLLLLDVRAHSNAYHFCRWCHQTFPQIQIFLLDSLRKEISGVEHQIALKNGALNLLPAMNCHNLVLNSTEVLQNINQVLDRLGSPSLSKEALLSVLNVVNEHMGYGEAGVDALTPETENSAATATIPRDFEQERSDALAEVRSLAEVNPSAQR